MVDRRVAETGLAVLGEAITEISEAAQDAAVRPMRGSARTRRSRIAALEQAGEDISALASAMEVLQRLAPSGKSDGSGA